MKVIGATLTSRLAQEGLDPESVGGLTMGADPVAYAGTDRNFYDRYFFNGYAPDGSVFFAAAMGFLWLGVAPLVSGIIARVFGLTHFNTLYGIVFLSHQVGSFFGAWMGGVVFDWRGNYDLAWAALIAIGLTAFALQWLMDERPPPARPRLEPATQFGL